MKTPPPLSPFFVAQALTLQGSYDDTAFSLVTSDSRKVIPGSLFVALPGERVDGHFFIPQAIASGARAILCQRGSAQAFSLSQTLLFEVEHTLEAYRKLAAHWRAQFKIPVLCVAGSVGKTTTKELLAAILSGSFQQVLKTQGSQNGFIGIPMTLLDLTSVHDIAVIEVGIDEIGAMEKHMPLVSPSSALLTAIGPEHLEKLIDLPTVAKEERLALEWTKDHGGKIVVNLDDPWIQPHFHPGSAGNVFGFTLGPTLITRDFVVSATIKGTTLLCQGLGSKIEPFELPLPGDHNARNLLGAITLAFSLGMNADSIRKGLSSFKSIFGRSEIKELPGPSPVLCDYYNANPSSMKAAFGVLNQLAQRAGEQPRTRWACLGDMLELGAQEEALHRELAQAISERRIEHVLLYGPRMKVLADELLQSGFSGDVRHFSDHQQINEILISEMRPGDALLIKGSRGMKMEELWKLFEPWARGHWA